MTSTELLIFLYGADMDPVAVRAAYPGAQFVARARVEAGGVTAPQAAEAQADVWGILVRVPAEVAAEGGRLVTATTDEGITVTTTPATAAAALADPTEVLAAARYWELPPSYVAALAAAS